MRRSTLALVLALVAFLGAFSLVPAARAQDADHGGRSKIVLDDLDIADRQRARTLFNEIVCDCPRENWSKSLLNCPDGCADPQKQEVLHQIQEGWTDEQIIGYQVQSRGPRAHGKPDDLLTYLLPVLTLLGAALVVGVVFVRWRKAAEASHASRRPSAPPADDELAAVERELQELR